MKKIFIALLISNILTVKAKDLTILTYNSFTSEFGPAAKLSQLFETQCQCKINWQTSQDSMMMLRRLQLEKQNLKADLIIGLDNQSIGEALATNLVANLNPQLSTNFGLAKNALPIDYGYLAFIKRSDFLLPEFNDLADFANYQGKITIALPDPRTSSVGASFLAWTHLNSEQNQQIWNNLRPKIKKIPTSWSGAYSLFIKKQVDVVLSYTTSPIYHKLVEKDNSYQAIIFKSPHYQQIEYAVMLKNAQNPKLAEQFLQFLLSKPAQKAIALNNWMYPVVDGVDLPDIFLNEPKPKGVNLPIETIQKQMPIWLKDWRKTLMQ